MPNDVKTIVAVLQSELGSIKTTIEETKQMIQRHIDDCDERYAPKWVQTAIMGVAGTVITTVIVALLALVIKK